MGSFMFNASLAVAAMLMVGTQPILLSTSYSPPMVTVSSTGEVAGAGIGVLECSIKSTGNTVAYIPQSWAGAAASITNKTADGFFFAAKTDARDQVGVLSTPLTRSNRVWYTPKDKEVDLDSPAFKQQGRVGIFAASASGDIARAKGFQNIIQAEDVSGLVVGLLNDKFDAVFVVERIFEELPKPMLRRYGFKKTFGETAYGGVYFSKEFLADKPDFMEKFNLSVQACRGW